MIVKTVFDGMRTYVSSKGTTYADIYVRGVSANGTEDFEQVKLRTFNNEVINACIDFNKDDILELDLTIRDAMVEGVL